MSQLTSILSFLLLSINYQCLCLKMNFNRCGGKVLELRLYGCQNDTEPCLMSRGIKGRLEVDFEAPFDSDYVYADVSQKTNSFLPAVPLPIVDRDACTNHGLTCPIVKGKKYNYYYDFYVDPRIPSIEGDYYLTLSTYWGYTVGCVNIPMQIAETDEPTVKHDDLNHLDEPSKDKQQSISSNGDQNPKDSSSLWFYLL